MDVAPNSPLLLEAQEPVPACLDLDGRFLQLIAWPSLAGDPAVPLAAVDFDLIGGVVFEKVI